MKKILILGIAVILGIQGCASGIQTLHKQKIENIKTQKFYVISDTLNVREGPGTSFNVIGKLHKMSEVTCIAVQEKWHKIEFSDKYGWVHGEYLTIPLLEEIPGRMVVVKKDMAEIRKAPFSAGKLIFKVKKGDILGIYPSRFFSNIAGKQDTWYRLDLFVLGEMWIYEEAVTSPIDAKYFEKRLDLKTRKEIFYELVNAQDKGDREAQQGYPSDLKKQTEYAHELYNKYCLEVCRKYKVSTVQANGICSEGVDKQWPMP